MEHILLQDLEVMYFHAYIDGVDFVFIDSPVFRHLSNNIYGGNRLVRLILFSLFFTQKISFSLQVLSLVFLNPGYLEANGVILQSCC